jgi:hypothetical protein
MRRVRSAGEASMFRGQFVAYIDENEYREPLNDGMRYGYVNEKVERYGGFEVGHELQVV